MESFSKKITINENQSMQYDISSGLIPIHTITSNDTNDFTKTIMFSKWSDYSFKSWYRINYEDNEKINKQTHIFNSNHPLYISLLHLLNGKEELIIDDDETDELNKKYIKIYRDKNDVIIDFINNKDKIQVFDKFSVFIKNTEYDLRSKTDCLKEDTKERLYFFFEEVYNLFKESYHQITTEEYLLNKNELTTEECKKYVRKIKR